MISANSQSIILVGSLRTIKISVASAEGPAINGMANGTMQGSPCNCAPMMPFPCGKNHPNGNDKEHNPTSDAHRLLLQIEKIQQILTKKQENQQNYQGEKHLPEDNRPTAFLFNIFQKGKNNGMFPNGSITRNNTVAADRTELLISIIAILPARLFRSAVNHFTFRPLTLDFFMLSSALT